MLLTLFAAPALAAVAPAFDPRSLKSRIAGKPAQILVLGSPHLSQLPEKLDPALLGPLLDRLAAFKPQVITIEALSGEECDVLMRFKAAHGTAWDDYCWPTDAIEKATGLSVPAAMAEIGKTLAAWPAAPTPAQRRRLAMLFIASNDRPSATVQWLRLPEAERRAGDGLDASMVELLLRKGKPPNENIAIGAALAARLGLERVYLVDDHIADSPDEPGYGEAIQRVWNVKPVPSVRTEYQRREASLKNATDVLDLYRHLNAPGTQRATIAADMGAAALQSTPQLYGRQYLAWWETRNLRMVANIRAAYAHHPDSRVLVIVGATHKAYFDAYLDMMQDAVLVDTEKVLK
ncbi:MAG TPA: DUF5694 domain-containing protein [Sphingomicrobium sp.]|nr:DUF5694 domain-containing protein [Sphingomicrobium sp.]